MALICEKLKLPTSSVTPSSIVARFQRWGSFSPLAVTIEAAVAHITTMQKLASQRCLASVLVIFGISRAR
jgi:hypothetical protein